MPYLLAAIVVFSVIAILMVIGKKGGSSSKKKGGKNKSQAQIIKEANRKLARNPNDEAGLTELGDLYFSSGLWDKAYPIYDRLTKLAKSKVDMDPYKYLLRASICAIKLEKNEEALLYLQEAYKKHPHDFDLNYNLGIALYKLKQYDKAATSLKKSLLAKPEAEGVSFILGHCLYLGHHFHDSLPLLKKALTEDPGNKEALFCMADAMAQEGHGDKAIKVFMHLRADPSFGPKSCLQAGIYHANMGDYDNAIQDFTIGLKHENIDPNIKLETEYRLGICYFSKNQFANGLVLLKQVRSVNPNYKDTATLIARYQELSQNSNLQIYLSAGTGEFVALCRKVVAAIYKDSNIKILDINVGQIFTDIIAEIDSPKFQDTEIFRFFRTTGSTGELYVRDFHGHLHDIKADKGFCITAGIFSDEARKYTEGRPVDLLEKAQLTQLLKKIA